MIPAGKFGETVSIALPFVNWGTVDATDVTVSLVVVNDETLYPFEITRTSHTYRFDKPLPATRTPDQTIIKQNQRFATFYNLKLRENVKSGYYPLRFVINYAGNTAPQPIERYTYIKVTGDPKLFDPPSDQEPDAIVPSDIPTDFGGGGYYGGGGDGSDGPASTPRLMISSFHTEPATVMAGETFKIVTTLRNTSTKTDISNIQVSFKGAEGTFLPTSGSSSIYVPSIAKEESATVEIEMQSPATLEQKAYSVSINMAYENDKAAQLSAEDMISIPVRQQSRIDFSETQIMPEFIQIGSDANLMFSIYNKGKSTLYNVTVEFPEDSPVQSPSFFAGNMEAGTAKDVDMMVTGLAPLMEPDGLVIQVIYEDDAGNETVVERNASLFIEPPMEEFNVEPMDGVMFDEFGNEIAFAPDGMPINTADAKTNDEDTILSFVKENWPWFAGGGAVLLLLVSTAIVRKRRRAKELALLEDDE